MEWAQQVANGALLPLGPRLNGPLVSAPSLPQTTAGTSPSISSGSSTHISSSNGQHTKSGGNSDTTGIQYFDQTKATPDTNPQKPLVTLRKGKWTSEEEALTKALIEAFNHALLNVPTGRRRDGACFACVLAHFLHNLNHLI